jgi:hypothetical protein
VVKTLDIGIRIPLDVVTRATAVVANRGAGKTSTASVIVEEAHAANVPVVILDPVGAWWGIRSSVDGKSAGLPFYLFGGEHSPDVPLYEESGEQLADVVLEYGLSVVLDMSLMRKGAMKRFAADFLDRLYQKSRTSVLVVIEEAPLFAPQDSRFVDPRLLGACEDLALRGRGRGIGVVFVAQRAQSISKSVLSQCEVLIAMRQAHNLDRKAIREWIDEQADSQHTEVVQSLSTLQDGEAYVWIPVHKILERVRVRRRRTFDSGATPEPGKRRVEPKKRATLDMEALKGKLTATIERAKANDPKLLRARIADMEKLIARQLHSASKEPERAKRLPEDAATIRSLRKGLELAMKVIVKISAVGIATLDADEINKVLALAQTHIMDKVERAMAEREKQIARLSTTAEETAKTLRSLLDDDVEVDVEIAKGPTFVATQPGPRRVPPPTESTLTTIGIPKGEQAILTACAQHDGGCDRQQLTALTGYKRSTRDAYIQALMRRGLVTTIGASVMATDAGRASLGDSWEPLPTGDALREHWLPRLPAGERAVLECVTSLTHPNGRNGIGPVSREAITDATGYKRSTRDAYVQALARRKLVTVDREGVRASPLLFG